MKGGLNVRRAVQMRIHRDDPVYCFCQQRAEDMLADRLSAMKDCVLTHVTEIWRYQNYSLRAVAPQGFGGKQDSQKFLIWLIERNVEDYGMRRWAHRDTYFAVRESMHFNPVRGDSKPQREALRYLAPRRQRMNNGFSHGFALSGEPRCR